MSVSLREKLGFAELCIVLGGIRYQHFRPSRQPGGFFVVGHVTLTLSFGGHLCFSYCSSVAVEEKYGRLDTTGHIILVYIFGALVLPFLGLLAQLLGFHVMLSKFLTVIVRVYCGWYDLPGTYRLVLAVTF